MMGLRKFGQRGVGLGFTLYHCVRGFYRREVGDYSDVVIPVGVLNVNGDGFLHFPVETGDHPSGACHVSQTTLVVIAGGRNTLVGSTVRKDKGSPDIQNYTRSRPKGPEKDSRRWGGCGVPHCRPLS